MQTDALLRLAHSFDCHTQLTLLQKLRAGSIVLTLLCQAGQQGKVLTSSPASFGYLRLPLTVEENVRQAPRMFVYTVPGAKKQTYGIFRTVPELSGGCNSVSAKQASCDHVFMLTPAWSALPHSLCPYSKISSGCCLAYAAANPATSRRVDYLEAFPNTVGGSDRDADGGYLRELQRSEYPQKLFHKGELTEQQVGMPCCAEPRCQAGF